MGEFRVFVLYFFKEILVCVFESFFEKILGFSFIGVFINGVDYLLDVFIWGVFLF